MLETNGMREANNAENKMEIMLPKTLIGTVHKQHVRCGKPNCKCAKGEPHGAYYYHFARINGKLKKRYLRPDEVEQTQTAYLARQNYETARRSQLIQWMRSFRELNESFRLIKQSPR